MHTPWGESETIKDYRNGIRFVTTAGHGGFFVPKKLLNRIPKEGIKDAYRWTRNEQWYEEDCCYAWVIISFPEIFPSNDIIQARKSLRIRGFQV